MTGWIWVAIVAVIGAFVVEYQKNKMKLNTRSRHNEKEVEELRKLVNSLKNRIENLEAIAAGDPDTFASTGSGVGLSEIEIEDSDHKQENEQKVSKLADKRRNQ